MEQTIDRALDAAARCVGNVQVGEDEDLCDECAYRDGRGQCMTALIHDLVEIINELRAEVARLRSCGTCGHREVCHILWLHGNDDFEISKPCGHWVEHTTPQPPAATAPLQELTGEPVEDEEEEESE